MIDVKERIGNFTSSQAYRLMANGRAKGSIGQPFYTYVKEKAIERKMGRSVELDSYSQSMAWGEFLELFAFNLLGMDYKFSAKKTDVHKKYKFWAGSKDFARFKDNKMFCIGDIKCYEPKKFAQYTDALARAKKTGDLRELKDNFKQEYWQLVSNAAVNGVWYAEAVTYMPYESEFTGLKEWASDPEKHGENQWKYRFIAEKEAWQLPVLPNSSDYKNINKFLFRVPTEDVAALTERVIKAEEELRKELEIM